jgi:glycosyltransferase involved in cell wall biosynthesis
LNGILFLVVRMQRGYGVSIVASEVAREAGRLGVSAAIACMEHDGGPYELPVECIGPDPDALARFGEEHGCQTIVCLTSPYFEVLPALASRFACFAWEWGDPTPQFFLADQDERIQIVENKRRLVYPFVKGVIAGSEFLRSDIGWAKAAIVYPAADHAPDLGPKTFADSFNRAPKLRVGTLMRLGSGEAQYKGNSLFREIKDCCDRQGLDCTFVAAGRGTEIDALPFRKEGMEVHLSISEDQKWQYLRGLDVFISCSLWEGFNLPLAEAQAMGTVGLAFDVGAHPEVTPMIMGSIAAVVAQLRAYSTNRELLAAHAVAGYRFVRGTYSWRESTRSLLEVIARA